MKTIKAWISGRVQGVFYRASTNDTACRLNIKGFVMNLPDGRVYLEAEGQATDVDRLIDWCRQGPPLARVSNIRVEEIKTVGFDRFEVRR